MLKYLPALFIVASQIPAPSIANSTCSNYWTNPKTGQEECLDLQNGIQTTPVPISEESQPQTTSDGYRFLAENEFGDRYFIRLGGIRKIGSQTYANARVRTFPKVGKRSIDFYSIWCDRRQFTTAGMNSVTFYGGSQGSIGYAIWDAACNREK